MKLVVLIVVLNACSSEKTGDDTGEAVETGEVEPVDSSTPETGDSSTPETGDTGQDTDPPGPPTEVCYPGKSQDYKTCFDLVDYSSSWGDGYNYPEPYQGNCQYIAPVRFIDLSLIDPETYLSPNFKIREIMQVEFGRYGIFQVHAMEDLQRMRDAAGGPIHVTSAYRNVTYNATVCGVPHSRHQYGDAADLQSSAVSIDRLEQICLEKDGHMVEYDGHVHCDWRNDTLDPAFFDE